MNGFGGNGFGRKTATAGTVITRLIQPIRQAIARVTKVVATAAGTAHTLTALRPLGRTKLTAAVAASGTSLPFLADPGVSGNALAISDLIAVRETDGVTRQYVVSAVPGGYPGNVTISGGLTVGAAINADVWNFGVEADTDPRTGEAHQSYALGASATTTFSDPEGGVIATLATDEPILLRDNNATAAGSIDQVSWSYTRE